MDRIELERQRAERLRTALIACAEAALEDARVRGLCWEGSWEAALAAMRAMPLERLLEPAVDGGGAEPGRVDG